MIEAELIPAGAEFVNADLYERANLAHVTDPVARSTASREWADARRSALLAKQQTFVSETVFSHASKLRLIDQAQRAGFLVTLLVVALDDPQRLVERVRQRVREGGHDVPSERVLQRYPRTLANLAQAVRLADIAMLYDSDGAGGTVNQQLIAVCRGNRTRVVREPLPDWARRVLVTRDQRRDKNAVEAG